MTFHEPPPVFCLPLPRPHDAATFKPETRYSGIVHESRPTFQRKTPHYAYNLDHFPCAYCCSGRRLCNWEWSPLLARRRLVEHRNTAACRRISGRPVSSFSVARPAPGRASFPCTAGSRSSGRTKHGGLVYDVVGWGEPVRVNNWPVDGRWYGNKPVMLADVSGAEAENLIPRIEKTVKA